MDISEKCDRNRAAIADKYRSILLVMRLIKRTDRSSSLWMHTPIKRHGLRLVSNQKHIVYLDEDPSMNPKSWMGAEMGAECKKRSLELDLDTAAMLPTPSRRNVWFCRRNLGNALQDLFNRLANSRRRLCLVTACNRVCRRNV